MKKEIFIFVGLFLFLAIGMHFKQWTTQPIEHIIALPNAQILGLGWAHPLVFTTTGYIIIGIIRLIFRKKQVNS